MENPWVGSYQKDKEWQECGNNSKIQQSSSDRVSKILGLLLQPNVRRTEKNVCRHWTPKRCLKARTMGIFSKCWFLLWTAKHPDLLFRSMIWYGRWLHCEVKYLRRGSGCRCWESVGSVEQSYMINLFFRVAVPRGLMCKGKGESKWPIINDWLSSFAIKESTVSESKRALKIRTGEGGSRNVR